MEKIGKREMNQEIRDYLKTQYLGDYLCLYFKKSKEDYIEQIELELKKTHQIVSTLSLEKVIPIANRMVQKEMNFLFEQSVKEIVDLLINYFRPKVRRDIVDELVQQVLLAIQTGINRHQYLGKKPIKAYARGIAHNIYVDFLREAKKRPEDYREIITGFDDNQRLTPEENLLLKENAKIVERCIHNLSYELRIIIILITYFNIGLREVSQVLNIPFATVQSRKSEAMDLLIEMLSKELGE